MKTSCPHCGQHYDVDDSDLGKEADCTNCGKRFQLEASMPTDTPVLEPPTSVDLENDRSALIAAIVRRYLRPGDDELMRQVLEIVIGERKASSSYFQRRLAIGYNIAAELVDELERRGIIGGPTAGGGKREILLPPLEAEPPPKTEPSSLSVSHCPYCDGEISPGVKKCRHCGEWIDASEKPQSHVVYIILAMFFGGVGIHNFVAGQKFSGTGKILLSMTGLRMICVFPHHWIGYSFFALNAVWIVADIVLFCQGKSGWHCLKRPQKWVAVIGLLMLLIASLIYGEYYKLAVDSVEASYSLACSGRKYAKKYVTKHEAFEIRWRVAHLPFADEKEVERAAHRGIDDGIRRKNDLKDCIYEAVSFLREFANDCAYKPETKKHPTFSARQKKAREEVRFLEEVVPEDFEQYLKDRNESNMLAWWKEKIFGDEK